MSSFDARITHITYNNDDPEQRVWVPFYISSDGACWETSGDTTPQMLVLQEADLDNTDNCMYKAYVDAGGNVELYLTDYPEDEDAEAERLWIDDLGLMIERLQELRARAFAYFGQEWEG